MNDTSRKGITKDQAAYLLLGMQSPTMCLLLEPKGGYTAWFRDEVGSASVSPFLVTALGQVRVFKTMDAAASFLRQILPPNKFATLKLDIFPWG